MFCCVSVEDTDHMSDNLLSTRIKMQAAQTIWNYMLVGHEVKQSDVILVLGNNDIRTAAYGAKLYLQGLGDWLMFSGKDGSLTKGKWDKSEAEVFRDIAISQGVPVDKIILETDATNTVENVKFSCNKLTLLNLKPKSIILVQTPYMERRSYATFKKQWKRADSVQLIVTSPQITLCGYPNCDVGSVDDIIKIMLGCLQRIILYPKRGYQIYQEVPNKVHNAFQKLLRSGLFNDHLLVKGTVPNKSKKKVC